MGLIFAQPRIDEATLSGLHLYDDQLTTELTILCEEVGELKNTEQEADPNVCLTHFFEIIDNRNLLMIERDDLISGGDEVAR
ncbi:hypothetical protein JXB12_11510 [candidate division KSB1 bacterium]|nr:hypothetical protein [candidate division KSB1 bacterium]